MKDRLVNKVLRFNLRDKKKRIVGYFEVKIGGFAADDKAVKSMENKIEKIKSLFP